MPAFAQMQSDTSDTYWSVVLPKPAATDIDMQKVLAGTTKDSVVGSFVSNVGSWVFRVDSIYFRGADAQYFSLVSGFPKYKIESLKSRAAEFRFSPNHTDIRLYEAEIVIVTQAETLIRTIRGESIRPKLEIVTDLLDFGQIEVGNDTTITDAVLIKNISNSEVTIDNVVQLGPDKNQFYIINGGGSFTLAPKEFRKMTLMFKPIFGGRTSGQLGFEYSGTGSPAVARLYGKGIGGVVYVTNDSAYAGESRTLSLAMSNVKPEGIAAIANSFEAKIRFQRTILSPEKMPDWNIINDSIYVNLKGVIGNTLELAPIHLIAGLGNVEETAIDVVEMYLIDKNGNKIEYDFEKQSGNFRLLGICDEGGTRLLNPDNVEPLMAISPNPSDGNVNIVLNLIEDGATTLRIYNSIGDIVFEKNIDLFTGQMEIVLESSELCNGLYFVSLQTPTIKKSEQLMILK
jgi:hypothetical protein